MKILYLTALTDSQMKIHQYDISSLTDDQLEELQNLLQKTKELMSLIHQTCIDRLIPTDKPDAKHEEHEANLNLLRNYTYELEKLTNIKSIKLSYNMDWII